MSMGVEIKDSESGLGPNGTGRHKTIDVLDHLERRDDLIKSFDRLVQPLDQILSLMRVHASMQRKQASMQRRLFALMAAVALLVTLAAVYQLHLTTRLAVLEDHLSALSKTGEETERKVDEVKARTPEVRVTTSPSGQASAYLLVKPSPNSGKQKSVEVPLAVDASF